MGRRFSASAMLQALQKLIRVARGDTRLPGKADRPALPRPKPPPATGSRRRATNADAWHALRIAHGVAESGGDYALGEPFPMTCCSTRLGGVGFRKGCYVGQEVVSRMQHRGTARRRVLIATAARTRCPRRAPTIVAGGRAIGALGTVVGRQGARDRCASTGSRRRSTPARPITAGEGAAGRSRSRPGAKFTFPLDSAGAKGPDGRQGRRSAARLAAHAVGPPARPARPLAARHRDLRHRARAGARGPLERPDRGDHAFSVAQHSLLVEEIFCAVSRRPSAMRGWPRCCTTLPNMSSAT